MITAETQEEAAKTALEVQAGFSSSAETRNSGIDWHLLLFTVAYLAADYIARTLPVSHGVGYPFGAMLGAGLSTLLFLYVANGPAGTRTDVGLTSKQRPGSLAFSLAAAGLILVTYLTFGRASTVHGGLGLLQSVGVAPVTEELAFRGAAFALLVRAFGSRSSLWPVLITSVCFALPHSFIYEPGKGAFAGGRFAQVLIMGAILGFVRARSGSLLFPVLCHVIWNGSLGLASLLTSIG